MKKLSSIILIAVAAVALFAGCSSPGRLTDGAPVQAGDMMNSTSSDMGRSDDDFSDDAARNEPVENAGMPVDEPIEPNPAETGSTTAAETDSVTESDETAATVSETAITTTVKADENVPDKSEAVSEGDDDAEYETAFVNADYPYYNSLQELYDAADLVIVARNNRNESTIINMGDELPYTVSNMSVTDVFKGDKSIESIDVKQLGGLMDGVMYTSQSVEQLVQDGEYLLFLETYDKSPASLLNPVQGMYYVEGSTFTARPENSIAVTLEDLSALSADTVS